MVKKNYNMKNFWMQVEYNGKYRKEYEYWKNYKKKDKEPYWYRVYSRIVAWTPIEVAVKAFKKKKLYKISQTRYVDGEKQECMRCHKIKPLKEFNKNKRAFNWRKTVCRQCDIEYKRQYRADPEKRKMENERRKQKRNNDIKQKIQDKLDRYLYIKDPNYKKSKERFIELWEWDKIKKNYKKNYVLNNVPDSVITAEEKEILFGKVGDNE